MPVTQSAREAVKVLMFTDQVGSTQQNRARTLNQMGMVKAAQHEITDDCVKRCRGTVLKDTGDGHLIEFPSPALAVVCGRLLQDGTSRHNAAQVDSLLKFELHIGIDMGTVLVKDDGDAHGPTADTAARVCQACPTGEVLFTEKIMRELHHQEVEVAEVSLELKGFATTVKAYRLVKWIGVLPTATPQSGTQFGAFEISEQIGKGGMGEVYRARDTRLKREVAIKMLPAEFSSDPDRGARFQREAELLAALNHPNIASIYDLEHAGDRMFLVMELVPGETLADRIRRGPIPIDESLVIAKQIAEALETAHEKGIIHRDLKPANIKVTPDGRVKVLDFGLAKAFEGNAPGADLSAATTLIGGASTPGMILGTPAYMSPEQARGLAVDRRSDIFAFGAVLYEMLTGRPAFEGTSVSGILDAIATTDPDWTKLPATLPLAGRNLLRLCFEKNVKKRRRDAGDLRLEIEEIQESLTQPLDVVASVVVAQQSSGRKGLLLWAALLIVTMAGAVGWWRATRPAEQRPPMRVAVEMSPDLSISRDSGLAISPDGSRIVVRLLGTSRGPAMLYTRRLDQPSLTPITGSEGGADPIFSPDGLSIVFAAGGKLKKVTLEGGSPVTVYEGSYNYGASWGDDDHIVFALGKGAAGSGIMRVASSGGAPQQLTRAAEGTQQKFPQVLPGSQAVLYTVTSTTLFDDATIEAFSLKTGRSTVILHGGYSPRYVATPNGGWLLYVTGGKIFAAPFDADRLTLKGSAVSIADGVGTGLDVGATYAASRNGTVVYLAGKGIQGTRTIVWIDPSGALQPLQAKAGTYFSPRLSPDGKRLALSLDRGDRGEVWVKDLERDTMSLLSTLDGVNDYPVWMPDGAHIIFHSDSPKAPGLYWVRSDGAGQPVRLGDASEGIPYSISPDGKHLATGRGIATIGGDADLPTLGKPEVLAGSHAGFGFPTFSPDGRWLAYVSNENGTAEVYVQPYPGPGGRWQISSGGGRSPVWSRAKPELLYSGGGRVMSVAYVAKGNSFTPARPQVWSETPVSNFTTVYGWDLAPDGKRVASIHSDPEDVKPVTHLTFVMNVFETLLR